MTKWNPEQGEDQMRIPKQLPVLPLRDIVVYPFIIVPLSVSRERSIQAIDHALAENRIARLFDRSSGLTARAVDLPLPEGSGDAEHHKQPATRPARTNSP